MYDVIIVGAGPAGLSAALVLGRSRRQVLVCDGGKPRNRHSRALHGYLTRDGIRPDEFLRLARAELEPYASVEIRATEVTGAQSLDDHFDVELADRSRLSARTLLIATGVVDELPDLEGVEGFYGSSVHHCPYCDAWEWRDQPLAVYGSGEAAAGLALSLLQWSRDVLLCTGGAAAMGSRELRRLARHGIPVLEEPVARLEGTDGMLQRIILTTGEVLPRRALFFSTRQHQHCDLPALLGCEFDRKGAVRTGKHESTNIPGLFVAGDASKDAQLVVVAAAEGAQAAVAINAALLKAEQRRRSSRTHRAVIS